jgi:hypothetical protein
MRSLKMKLIKYSICPDAEVEEMGRVFAHTGLGLEPHMAGPPVRQILANPSADVVRVDIYQTGGYAIC